MPECRYCGADCSNGRSYDGAGLYACTQCADARAVKLADGLRLIDYRAPLGLYAAGWRDAVDAAGKCGSYNSDDPRPQYALCVRERGHTGKHDDMWKSWGDRYATAEQNRTDAGDHSRWLRHLRERQPPGSGASPTCPAG